MYDAITDLIVDMMDDEGNCSVKNINISIKGNIDLETYTDIMQYLTTLNEYNTSLGITLTNTYQDNSTCEIEI